MTQADLEAIRQRHAFCEGLTGPAFAQLAQWMHADRAALLALVDVPYKPGLPSVEQMRMQEERGGCWLIKLKGDPRAFLAYQVRLSQGPGEVLLFYRAGPIPGNSYWDHIENIEGMRPCSPEGTPLPWPEVRG